MLKLASSNPNKLREYKEMFPDIEGITIQDLPEIKAEKDLVILYKVKELNQKDIILEDTILEVFENNQWHEIVDIKFKHKSLKNDVSARWVVSLGIMQEDNINIYRGEILGTIRPSFFIPDTFGFDSMFFPDTETRSLLELTKENIKANFSARRIAIENLKSNKLYLTRKIIDLPKWDGSFQAKE